MADNFEDFIAENRDKFDIYEPGDGPWKKIEKALKMKNGFGKYKILIRVAGIAAIFVVAFMLSNIIQNRKAMDAGAFLPVDASDGAPVQLRDAEAYYTRIINARMNEIEPIMAEFPGLEEELMLDFSELDNIYSELKNDLRENISNEEVIKAIMENYRFKIAILEDMLIELDIDNNECVPITSDYEI